MSRDILVSILCDDLFARDWMALLMVRDWRTRIVSESYCSNDLRELMDHEFQKVDFLIVDLDSLYQNPDFFGSIDRWLDPRIANQIICVSSKADPKFFKLSSHERIAGYLTKDEIAASLAWAITFASEGNFVMTPSVQRLGHQLNHEFPAQFMVLQARPIPGLTPRQAEISRLAILFSVGRRDLADELKISDQWSYGMVSELYESLGLKELFEGEADPYRYIYEDKIIQTHLTEILAELGDSKKAKDLETLAFHLITMPVIEEHRQ